MYVYIYISSHLISSHLISRKLLFPPKIGPRSNAKVDCHALALSQALITLPNAMISIRCPCRWILMCNQCGKITKFEFRGVLTFQVEDVA